ncbi:MAG: hypothetical protein ACFB0C_02380 [Leptolyngbyaceae cyanobacterium]
MLAGGLFWDSPQLPWSLGTFDKDSLLKDPHTHPLARLLEMGSPDLYQRWFYQVLPPAYAINRQEEDIKALQPEISRLAEEVGALEQEVSNQPNINPNPEDDFPPPEHLPKPKSESWEIALTIGLSLMLFLGIAAVLGIEVQGVTLDQIPMLLFAIAGAVCMNIAEFQGIYRFVVAYYRFEPWRSHDDDERYANQIPFWHHIRSGNPTVWISLTIVLLETLFAFIGLISQLPPRLQASFGFQLTAFAAAALAATVNLVIAWGNALGTVQWEQTLKEQKLNYHQALEARLQNETYLQRREQYWQKAEKIAQERQTLHKQLGAAQKKLQVKQIELQKQEQDLKDLKRKAVQEYERWEHSVRRWIKENPNKVENFSNLHSQWNDAGRNPSNNGYSPYEPEVGKI